MAVKMVNKSFSPIVNIQFLSNNNAPLYIDSDTKTNTTLPQTKKTSRGKIRSTEDFKKYIYELYGDEYSVLGEFIKMKTKIKMRHKKCGHEWNVKPAHIVYEKTGCPICNRKSKTTTEDFKKTVKELVGDEYDVIGEFVNVTTKVRFRHNCDSCGNFEFLMTPDCLKRGQRCPKCFGTHKKTTEEFKKEVYALVGDEYDVLGEYINAQTKTLFRHNICGFEYENTPNSFLSGHRCPKCAILKSKNRVIKPKVPTEKDELKRLQAEKEFKQKVFDSVGDKYSVIGKFKNYSSKVKMRHNECGYEYEPIANSFLAGHHCPKCAGNIRKTTEDFKREVYELVGDEYDVLGKYINTNTKILMKHNVCGNSYGVKPSNFKSGNRCPYCFGKHKKTHDEFVKEVYDLVGDEYDVKNKYKNVKSKVLMRHNTCGNEYWVKASHFLEGSRCPHCIESRGEKLIGNFLTQKGIQFAKQYKIDDCKYKKQLPFDFAVFYPNRELAFLIEFQGKQHYLDVEIFADEWIDVFHRDMIKRKYCFDNAIPLLTFTFWELKKGILKQELEETFAPLMEYLKP